MPSWGKKPERERERRIRVAICEPTGDYWQAVAGVSFCQATLRKAARRGPTADVVLMPDPENEHDPDAVVVLLDLDGELPPAGFLPAGEGERYRGAFAALARSGRDGLRCEAKIVGGHELRSGRRASLGLRLDLPDPDELAAALD